MILDVGELQERERIVVGDVDVVAKNARKTKNIHSYSDLDLVNVGCNVVFGCNNIYSSVQHVVLV
jgi:hypothetical protein